jgi:poly(hydroxyalkanoate) depolymerase family esterase
MPRLMALVVGVLFGLATTTATAAAEPPPSGPGQISTGTVTSNGTAYPYLLYTPASRQADRPAPLLVVAHGCQTTARQEMELTRYNDLAEREGLVVLYPEVDELGRQLPGPLENCWRFFDPTAYFRGNNDPAAIAAMTGQVVQELNIDAERVYLVGVSAGGLMASASAAAYPDLYAADGVVASAGYADGLCFTTGIGIPVETSALLAFVQMGPRARVVPAIAIGSDADQAFPASCTNKALEQSLRTNNLVLSGAQDGPLSLVPHAVTDGQVPDGLAYTASTFVDPDGCLVGERWIIHGMPHAWPGGADYGGYTDTRAPDGAEATWAFLRRYRKSDTALPCAETVATAAGSEPPPPALAGAVAVPSTVGAVLPATGGRIGLAGPALLVAAALAAGAVARSPRS